MKKALLVVVILAVVAAAGLAVVIATFDADRYRPLLIRQLEQALKRPVQLQRLSLGWRQGLAIRLQGLVIPDEPAAAEPLLAVESADALVKLLPLLRKDVQVTAVILTKPRVHVARDAQGRVNLLGLAAVAAPAGAAAPQAGQPVTVAVQTLRLQDGSVHWSDASTRPATELWLKALQVHVRHIVPGEPMDVDAAAALNSATQNLTFSGRVTLPGPGTAGSVEEMRLDLKGLPLQSLMAAAGPEEPQLRGVLTLGLQGRVPSLAPETLRNMIAGTGRVTLAEPVAVNFNLLREVFSRLSMLPGLVQALESRLPPEYQEKLRAKDTVLSPIDLAATLEQGGLRFENSRVRTEEFGLIASGRVGLDGVVAIAATLQIEPELSAAIVRSVKELQALANQQGELQLPLVIQGQAPQVAVLPDLKYVASRVLVTTAVDALSRLLQKPQEGDADGVEPGVATGTEGPPSPANMLGNMLQRALQPPDGGSPP